MTRLTLEYHLRAIVEGVPEDEYEEEVVYSEALDKERTMRGDLIFSYTDTGSGPYARTDASVNVAYDDSMATQALQSDDPVAYLDAVAHDPCVPMQWRFDAEELLGHHIAERRLICLEENRSIMHDGEVDNNSEMRSAFAQNGRAKSMRPSHWTSIRCPECLEGECLFDVDQPAEPNHCLNCGELIPMPTYPDDAPV